MRWISPVVAVACLRVATGLPATWKGSTSSQNKVDALPPEETQLAQTLALLRRIETGNATFQACARLEARFELQGSRIR